MEEEIKDFINESQDYIEFMEPKLINLLETENREERMELINMSFRNFHSIKGVASFLGFSVIQDLTHKVEELLNLIRNEKLEMNGDILEVVLQSIDILKNIFSQLFETKSDEAFHSKKEDLLNEISNLLNKNSLDQSSDQTNSTHVATEVGFDQIFDCFLNTETINAYKMAMNFCFDDISYKIVEYIKDRNQSDILKKIIGNLNKIRYNGLFFGQCEIVDIAINFENLLLKSLEFSNVVHSKKLGLLMESLEWMKNFNNGVTDIIRPYTEIRSDFKMFLSKKHSEMENVVSAEEQEKFKELAKLSNAEKLQGNFQTAANKANINGKSTALQDMRVDIDKLDTLVGLIETLNLTLSSVIKNTDLLENMEEVANRNLLHAKLTSDNLQDVAMSIRMVPISSLFNKMFRLVHDTSSKLNKKAKLEIVGENTEVDRNLIHKINDPLVHLIRNSMDHGIEMPDTRIASGKSAEGKILLKAYHSGGDIILELSDDGSGLNKEKILNKAIEKGIVKKGDEIKEDEIYNLILTPGFSTAEQVTNISGRGVGMDVCVKQIQKLNGKLNIESTPGQGTIFKIRLPVESTLVEGVLVRVDKMTYTIRTSFIREIIHSNSSHLVITPSGDHYIKLRNEIYKIIHLTEIFNKKPDNIHLEDSVIILVEEKGKIFGLIVDEILGKTQGVVKPLPKLFNDLRGIAGCSLTGTESHQVSWIVDVDALAKQFAD